MLENHENLNPFDQSIEKQQILSINHMIEFFEAANTQTHRVLTKVIDPNLTKLLHFGVNLTSIFESDILL